MFAVAAVKVVTMIALGLPGFLLIKTGALSEKHIKGFASFLLYVCQPALSVYSLDSVDCTREILVNVGVFFAVTLVGQIALIGIYTLIFRKKLSDAAHRVCSVAVACGNVGFLGIPLLEQLLPDHPEALVYSAAFSISMNVIAWTLGLTLITGDRRFISVKALILNPATLAFAAAFPLFVAGVKLPDALAGYAEMLGRASTVVCMTVLGMRLALNRFRDVFGSVKVYVTAAFKLLLFPALITLLFLPVPVDTSVKAAALILCSCPAAAMIQSLAETHGGDSATAANVVLSTNLMCILTIPLTLTLFDLIFGV